MKKILIALILVLAFCLGLLSCGGNDVQKTEPTKKYRIVATIFPAYDWTRQVIGKDNKDIDLVLLNTSGADLHSYKPTVEDIAKISTCDMLIYIGGESEEWVTKAAKEAQNKKLKTISLLDALGKNAKVEEDVRGKEHEEHKHEHKDDKHDHKDDKHDHKDDKEEPEYDEHVWLSLHNAQQFVALIGKEVSELDAQSKETYTKNANNYIAEIKALDDKYEKTAAEAKVKTILFVDRFPFRYLVDDYGIKYVAAFAGCSAETEASFKTIKFLTDKVDELGLKVVLKIERSSDKLAKTVVDNTKQKHVEIVEMHSLQAVSADDIGKGASYLKLMESNLSAWQKALK